LPDTAQALLSTLFVSIVPIFVIYLLNLLFLAKPSLRDTMIYYLISFAVGGLLGDVFFHTLPHLSSGTGGSSSSGHSHDHGHNHGHHEHGHGNEGHSHDPQQMMTNLIIIAGIVCFFLIEKVVS
jgi:solute carrier family 39 (zinc transporter), member 7